MSRSLDTRSTELSRQGAQWVSVIQEICCELGGSAESRKTAIERQRRPERPRFPTVAIGLLELYPWWLAQEIQLSRSSQSEMHPQTCAGWLCKCQLFWKYVPTVTWAVGKAPQS